jgi:signal transduction histidine kinase
MAGAAHLLGRHGVTAAMPALRSFARKYWLELLWVPFAVANLIVTVTLVDYETVPFHFIWISLTLVYGYRVWRIGATFAILAVVCAATAAALAWVVARGAHGPEELTEVPLMAAVFLAMVWYAEKRQAALLAVQHAAAREREFIRAASHELKTPIAIARGLAALVRDGDRADADLDELVDELEQLGRLAERLLDLAAAEQKEGLLLADVDVRELVLDAERRWSYAADRRWRVLPIDGVITGDQQRLDSMLDAVLENAVAATAEGDSIALSARADGKAVVLSVSDSGVGMVDESVAHAFKRFWSAPYGPEGTRGTGLGLSIVEATATSHGGTVALRSKLGHGTTVRIRLPGLRPSARATSELRQREVTTAR